MSTQQMIALSTRHVESGTCEIFIKQLIRELVLCLFRDYLVLLLITFSRKSYKSSSKKCIISSASSDYFVTKFMLRNNEGLFHLTSTSLFQFICIYTANVLKYICLLNIIPLMLSNI